MPDAIDVLEKAIDSVTRLRNGVGRGTTRQVKAADERDLVKATALAWIREHRPHFAGTQSDLLAECDSAFHELLEFSDRNTTRERYKSHLKALKTRLVRLRSDVVADVTLFSLAPAQSEPPDWSALVPDQAMQAILRRRWRETSLCLEAGAHLAATVMMGGMLEALLLARVNRVTDRSALFRTKACPRDPKTKKAFPLQKWTLQHYIDVAHEMGWIRESAKGVGTVLRDYRNYIHPAKELSHGVSVDKADTEMFWAVFQSLVGQIVASV